MSEITQLELFPAQGVIKTLGPPAVSTKDESKQSAKEEPKASTGVPEGGKPGVPGGTEVPKGNEVEAKTKSDDKTLEVPDKTAEVNKQEEALKTQYQAIAKREREFRFKESQARQQLNKMQAELSAKETILAEREANIQAFNKLAEDARRNPEPYLKHVFGDNWYDLATEYKLKGRPASELIAEQVETKMEQELRALREEREQEKRQLAQQRARNQSRQVQEDLESFSAQVESYITSKPDTFELITMQGKPAIQMVSQFIEANYYQTGKIIPTHEAAERVEKYLEQQYMSFGKAKKFAPKAEDKKIEEKLEITNPNPGARTLTNQMTASTPSVMTQNKTEADRIKRAIAAMSAVGQK